MSKAKFMKVATKVVFLTGAAGNGKTTFGRLLFDLFAPKFGLPEVSFTDMSKIIKWGMNQQDKLGEELRSFRPKIRDGKFLPDDPTLQTTKAWLSEVRRTCNFKVLIVAGAPRTNPQLALRDHFEMSAFFFTPVTQEISNQAVLRRWEEQQGEAPKSGEDRLDNQRPSVYYLQTRWDEYRKGIQPLLHALGSDLCSLEYQDPLHRRLNVALDYFEKYKPDLISSTLLQRARSKLSDPHHEISRAIQKIEGNEDKTPSIQEKRDAPERLHISRKPVTTPFFPVGQVLSQR